MEQRNDMNRREFLRQTATAAAGDESSLRGIASLRSQ
jgi:hypothetical protein